MAARQADETECQDTDWKQALQPVADSDEGRAVADSVLHALCEQHPRLFADTCILTVPKLNKALGFLRVAKNVSASATCHRMCLHSASTAHAACCNGGHNDGGQWGLLYSEELPKM
jgi:hypothetical protein